MNTIRTSKEFIFNLFLRSNTNIIKDLIGCDITNLEMEKNYHGRKIDIFGQGYQKEIFIESQISKADVTHLNQIRFIIDNVCTDKHTVIVWIAREFQENMLNNIHNHISKSKKNVEFIAVEIVDGIDDMLEAIGPFGDLEIVENLWKLKEVFNLEIVSKYFKKFPTNEVNKIEGLEILELPEKEVIMEKILKEMRNQIFYFPSVYREKSLSGNSIILGSGHGEINYAVHLNRSNNLVVELRFNDNTKDIFNELLKYKDEMEDCLGYTIQWDYDLYRIYSSVVFKDNTDRIIKQQVRILDKLIQYFTPFVNSISNKKGSIA